MLQVSLLSNRVHQFQHFYHFMDFYFVHLSGLAKNQIFISILYTKNPSNILGPKIFSLFLILYKFNPYFYVTVSRKSCYTYLMKRQCMPNIKLIVFCLMQHIFYLRQLNAIKLQACHNYFKAEQKLFSTQPTHIISTIIHDYI